MNKFNLLVNIRVMISFFVKSTFGIILILIANVSYARDFIRIVGSSTLYPFSSLIVEKFSSMNNLPSPIVESNGTGGGFAQFCKGIGFSFPDINNASRQITEKELALCTKNGIENPLAIKIGFDGITLIYSKNLGKVDISVKELFLALSNKVPSKENPNIWVPNFYKNWSEINPKLPNIPIHVMGPPNTSGTRGTFVEIVLNNGCQLVANHKLNDEEKKIYCNSLRKDDAWQDGSENYNLVLHKVSNSKNLFAIIGYSYYKMNATSVLAANINGVKPNQQSIMDGKYVLSRPLYIYVKKEHLQAVTGLKEFVELIINKEVLGESGFLVSHGLIPLSNKEYTKIYNDISKALSK